MTGPSAPSDGSDEIAIYQCVVIRAIACSPTNSAEEPNIQLAKKNEERKAELELEYQRLGSPKLMYTCNEKLGYIAGKGISNYNSIYIKAKNECGTNNIFTIIDSEK